MNKRMLITLFFCLCTSLTFGSYIALLYYHFNALNIVTITGINLFYGYFYSVLIKKFVYRELNVYKQILVSLIFCVCFGLNLWIIDVFMKLNAELNDVLMAVMFIITLLHGYLHSILLKKLIYSELKGNKKKITLIFFLVAAIVFIDFKFFKMELSNETSSGGEHSNNYICPDGTEQKDLSKCK
ncbi:hypothetical protein CON36_32920 [Bacillus cereus]|uniref:Uncharacterized protein n=1 Tax=Bacillus cereus TaxID=1396 RepID=A0A9X6XVU0_BACCE|nr:hypothetical protein [Bacillus cereus]PDZ94611.1 hypothetical protein CON36_32920 [Bacillus cereus]